MLDPTVWNARAAVEALRGYADLACYRPSQHMSADEYADALKAYAVVMGFLDKCAHPSERSNGVDIPPESATLDSEPKPRTEGDLDAR